MGNYCVTGGFKNRKIVLVEHLHQFMTWKMLRKLQILLDKVYKLIINVINGF